MRRSRSTAGNRLPTSSHLQRPVSPLRSVRKRDLFVGSFEENPSESLKKSVEFLDDDTLESLEGHSGSDSGASAYEDCKPVVLEPDLGTDSDRPSVSLPLGRPTVLHLTRSWILQDAFPPQPEAEFMLPENINDDTVFILP